MIVLGNDTFAIGMKFAGVKDSYVVKTREEIIELVKKFDVNDFIVANASVLELVPELADEFRNLVTVPDSAEGFGSIDDLKHIIKSVVGIEIEV